MTERVRLPKTDKRIDNIKPSPAWGFDVTGTLFIRCMCGECLEIDHTIMANGDVEPSLWHDEPRCGWHVMATLDGWGL